MNCPSGASREVIRVLVADSNEPQSQRLSSALDRQSGFYVATSLQERSESLRVLQDARADILLHRDGPADLEGLMRTLRTVHANLLALRQRTGVHDSNSTNLLED